MSDPTRTGADGASVTAIIVDDSSVIRALLRTILTESGKIRVVAEASDPYEARELIKRHNPDVVTLDVEMPKMNGIAFLKNIMRLRPMPVVMISTLTQQGTAATLEALEYGAVDFIGKPVGNHGAGLEKYAEQIVEKVYHAAFAKVRPYVEKRAVSRIKTTPNRRLKEGFVCAIGASTGGTEAIKDVLVGLPTAAPPVLVTQHIPAMFSRSYTQRVDRLAAVTVCEAEHQQPIQAGHVYVAPGDKHLRIKRTATSLICQLDDSEPVNRHRPSVQVMFDSLLQHAGFNCMGILLTGMGADGAAALLRMRQAGCVTVVQDEDSSIVWGMPGAAVKLGAAQEVLPLDKIAGKIMASALGG